MKNFSELISNNLKNIPVNETFLKTKDTDPIIEDFINKEFFYYQNKFDFKTIKSIETYDILLDLIKDIYLTTLDPNLRNDDSLQHTNKYMIDLFNTIRFSNLSQNIEKAKDTISNIDNLYSLF